MVVGTDLCFFFDKTLVKSMSSRSGLCFEISESFVTPFLEGWLLGSFRISLFANAFDVQPLTHLSLIVSSFERDWKLNMQEEWSYHSAVTHMIKMS